MAEVERSDITQTDLDVLVKAARSSSGGLDARVALSILVERLQDDGGGYYVWASLGKEALAVWQIRVPRQDLPKEKWLKNEDVDTLHLCRPVDFLTCVERRDKDGSADHVGYVREGKCTKCERPMPKDLQKQAEVQTKLHKLGRKR